MAGGSTLRVVWDGAVPGLSEHHVSISQFGPALTQLVAAARRIASNNVTAALEPADTGRLANTAKNLDIQIVEVIEGSGGFAMEITFDSPGQQDSLFETMAEKVGLELLESIEAESKGILKNAAVRRYLQALPRGLTRQSYSLTDKRGVVREVQLGNVTLAPPVQDLPSLVEISGRVAGVGFPPGTTEVKIKAEGVVQMTASATEKQVARALQLRSGEVRSLAVSSADGLRLLVLEPSEFSRSARAARANQAIFDKWSETFQELA